MSWYEYPNATESEGLFEYFKYVNSVSEGIFMPIILFVIWIVSFIGIYNTGLEPSSSRSFLFASFLISILSIMSVIMGFLAVKFMYLSFILTAIGILWNIMTKN